MASYAILRGAANPEGVVTGDRGWLYVRTGASAGVYQKTSGDGTNTGWAALGSGSVTDAELLAIAGLTSAADKLPYFTGSGVGGFMAYVVLSNWTT